MTKTNITRSVNEKHLSMLIAWADLMEVEYGMSAAAAEMLRDAAEAARVNDRDSLKWCQGFFMDLMTNEKNAARLTEAQERAEEMAALRAELH